MGDHYYSRAGEPAYEQITQKGGLRPTDIRDARKIGLLPSVTTVLAVLAKPALEQWKVKQGILAALTLTRRPGETDDDFLARVLRDSGEQAKAAAEEGTRIHDACEAYYKDGYASSGPYILHVRAVSAELKRLFPTVTDWVSEKSFGHEDGYGGKVDLHSPSTGIVVDFKGKDGDFTDGKKLHYDQNYQLGGYQHGLLLPRAPCANIFVSRTHPGKVASHVWTPDEIAYGRDVFLAALGMWKTIKKYESGYAAKQAA